MTRTLIDTNDELLERARAVLGTVTKRKPSMPRSRRWLLYTRADSSSMTPDAVN